MRVDIRGDWRLLVFDDWIISVNPPHIDSLFEAIKTARTADEIANAIMTSDGVVFRYLRWR